MFYTPETRLALGLVSLNTFRFKGEPLSSRVSQFQIGAAYTQEDQLLIFAPFDIYLKNEKWYFKGTTGYYRYTYYFYGIGNKESYSSEELYTVEYPRFRLNAMRLIKDDWYFGMRYWFENDRITEVEQDGLLATDQIIGSTGGVVSGAGIVSQWDSRDNYNYPTKGNYLEAFILSNNQYLGSDFDFVRYSLDYVNYTPFNEKTVLATNVYLVSLEGDPPFNELAFIGGRDKMRGYYLGRFRDKNLILLQTEIRRELFWRIGMTAFTAFGNVAPSINAYEIKNSRGTAGLGLRYRLNPEDKINIRIDYAVGENGSSGLYITFGEAF